MLRRRAEFASRRDDLEAWCPICAPGSPARRYRPRGRPSLLSVMHPPSASLSPVRLFVIGVELANVAAVQCLHEADASHHRWPAEETAEAVNQGARAQVRAFGPVGSRRRVFLCLL